MPKTGPRMGPGPAGGLATEPFQFSIGDARGYVGEGVLQIVEFQFSIGDAHVLHICRAEAGLALRFNSLLEMRDATGSAANMCVPALRFQFSIGDARAYLQVERRLWDGRVSILYWRCETKLVVSVAAGA